LRTSQIVIFTGFSAVFVYKTHVLTAGPMGCRHRVGRASGTAGGPRARPGCWRRYVESFSYRGFSLEFRLFSYIKPILRTAVAGELGDIGGEPRPGGLRSDSETGGPAMGGGTWRSSHIVVFTGVSAVFIYNPYSRRSAGRGRLHTSATLWRGISHIVVFTGVSTVFIYKTRLLT
jgi:hypothetical protein